MLARAGAEIENLVRCEHRVGIVLDHQQRVPQVAQAFQDLDQPVRVARMQSDRRLVEHVQGAHQMRSQRSGQLNPLRLAAGKSGSQPVKRQIVETHFVQKTQSLLDFLQHFIGDHSFGGAQLQAGEKRPRLLYRHLADLGDGPAGNLHSPRLGAQPRAFAVGAERVPAIAAQKHAHV